MQELPTTLLLVLGGAALAIVSFWLGRAVQSWNDPIAKQARLTAVALAAVKELKELRNPTKTPDTVAAAAREAAALADLKELTASVP